MKISEEEADKLFDKFWDNPFKHDRSKTLAERGMQAFWYNKTKFPFEPYCDCHPMGFDRDPSTYQDVLILQERMIKEFIKTPGSISIYMEQFQK
jgi:hypothetical protein